MPSRDVCGNCGTTENLKDCKRCSLQSCKLKRNVNIKAFDSLAYLNLVPDLC